MPEWFKPLVDKVIKEKSKKNQDWVMIKSILLIIKFGFIGFFNELRFLFKSLSEISISGFDNLNYHIFQT